MSLDRASAWVILSGSLLFLAAAFSPISRVFGVRDAAQKLEIIAAAPDQWRAAQLLFALGAIVTAFGVAMLALRTMGQPSSVYLTASAAVMLLGTGLWSWHVYLRAVDPALFVGAGVPVWLFAGYSLLTMAGLAFLGAALLLHDGVPTWVGWLSIGTAIGALVLALAFGDMPPLVYYLVTLTIGIMLLRSGAAGGGGASPAAGP